MRFRAETIGEAEERLGVWHKWFAWHPVFISGTGYVWLETVERKGTPVIGFIDFYGFIFEYRVLR